MCPGRNNQFLINTAHHLAITYNDISVLENFHAATLFSVLGESDCSLFSFVSADMFREKRKIIIDLILATDMKKHFEEISLFRVSPFPCALLFCPRTSVSASALP